MRSLLRSILSVVAGFLVATLVMTAIEAVNGRVFYPGLAKAAEGVTDREVIRSLMAEAPIGALLVVLFGWALGGLAGGWITAWIARSARTGHALVLGGLLTLAGVANNLMIPPPVWFWVAGLLVCLPGAWAGSLLAPRRA
jgi:hypothetical protein